MGLHISLESNSMGCAWEEHGGQGFGVMLSVILWPVLVLCAHLQIADVVSPQICARGPAGCRVKFPGTKGQSHVQEVPCMLADLRVRSNRLEACRLQS